MAYFRRLEKGLARIERCDTPNGPFWVGYDKDGKRLAVLVLTSAIARKESLGYSGSPVAAVLALDPRSLCIKALEFLPNDETPVYVGDMFKPEFARQYIGKGPDDPFRAGEDVQALSGATYTTNAINRSIRESLRRVRAAMLGRRPPVALPSPFVWLQTLVVAALFVAAVFAMLARLARVRLLLLAASILLLGFIWAGLMLSARNIVDLITHPADFVSGPFFRSGPLLILLFGGLGGAILFGRLYCGFICPFGALCEVIWTFNPKKVRVRPQKNLLFVKSGFLGLLVAFGFLLPRVDLLKHIEPFGPTFRMMDVVATITALVLIAISAVVFRFYCRFVCPLGAVFEVLSFFRIFRRRMLPRPCMR